MGRGALTAQEIEILKQNPYVEKVIGSRIIYSDEFKRLFVEEYFAGKKSRVIFEEAGFDVGVLGYKRIERCSARWRERNAAGDLGEKHKNNNFYNKYENERVELKRTIRRQKDEIEQLKTEIGELKEKLLSKEEGIRESTD